MYAEVIVDIASSEVDKIFEYEADENVYEGSRVIVPFGVKKVKIDKILYEKDQKEAVCDD